VFRIGGDEFAVISQGPDYERIEEILEKMSGYNAEAARSGKVIIACGMSRFDNDECVAQVFERADQNMYENKNSLKSVS
jgi:GGDEF domain-containing protein